MSPTANTFGMSRQGQVGEHSDPPGAVDRGSRGLRQHAGQG